MTSPNPAEQQELCSVLPGGREPTATTAPTPRVLSASIIHEVGLGHPALQGRGEAHTGLGARLGKLRCAGWRREGRRKGLGRRKDPGLAGPPCLTFLCGSRLAAS